MGGDPRGCAHGTRGARSPGLGDAASIASRAAAPCWRSITRATWTPSSWLRSCPASPPIVAKKELAGQVLPVRCCGGWACLFLERFDVADSLADLEGVSAAAQQGRLLVFFPEGTFTRRAGLSGFYLGAFRVAAQASLPVVPGMLRGTRSMLRGDQWFPRWRPVSIEIAAPIMPTGTDFAAIVKLRNSVRDAILAGCGEPDLGELVKPEAV